MVAIDGQQHADGIVVGTAEHEGRPAFGQGHQQVVGVAQAVGIGDDGGDVVQGDLAQFLALSLGVAHDEKAAMHEEMPPVVRDFDDAANHGASALEPRITEFADGGDGDLAGPGFLERPSHLGDIGQIAVSVAGVHVGLIDF